MWLSPVLLGSLFAGISPRKGNPRPRLVQHVLFKARYTASLAARSLDSDVESETGVGKLSGDHQSFADQSNMDGGALSDWRKGRAVLLEH